MAKGKGSYKTPKELEQELEELRHQLEEANDTIEAIRTGQIDALVVQADNGHQLYTLRSADQTYRIFIEKMTEGAVTLNPQGIILYCNSQFASMVHLSLSQVIGLPFEDFIVPEYRDEYRRLFNSCWRSDCKGEVFIAAGEDKTPVQLSLTTLELEEGVSLSVILTDLTSLKATQQQLKTNNEQLEATNHALEESNHDLQQFASVASHDLQEPLRKIQVFSNLLKDREQTLTPQARKYLQKILDSSSRMRELIVDVLNYSKLSGNHYSIELIDLNKIIKELRQDFEVSIEEKKAELVVSSLPTIEGNWGQIRQLFQNLISNALKFSKQDEAPVITITAKRLNEKSFTAEEDAHGPYCLISVKDNGIGFDEKYLSNIFALFERLNTKDKYAGTGIGMAIARKIVDKHDGIITATSCEGCGAEFKFILPLKRAVL